METNPKKLDFLNDRDSVERLSFAIFLRKLEGGFLALSPEAKTDLKEFVAGICQHSYEMPQNAYALGNL